MGALFRSEEVCLVQLFLQAGSAYDCVSELGELGLVEFRDLNPGVNSFQRKFVGEVRRCEEMEKTLSFLEQEIQRSMSPPVSGPLTPPSPAPPAPTPREALQIQEESESLAQELRQVSQNRASLRAQLVQLTQYRRVLLQTHNLTGTLSQTPLSPPDAGLDRRQDVRLSFIAGVVHPLKAAAFERLLWRACRGYIIVNFQEMEEPMEVPETGEMVQWKVFLISYWGDQIGQKVKKICDCYHTPTFSYPETPEERQDVLQGLERRIEEMSAVLEQTQQFLHQVLSRAVAKGAGWAVQVRKMKAVYLTLNLCSPSLTDKCLIAEAWCPVAELPKLNTALKEGSSKSGSGVQSFYNRIPAPCTPPTLFRTNAFTVGFQNIVDAYGVATYREVNPAVFTIVTFPFLFAVMFGDVGHGLLMVLFGIWLILQEKDPIIRDNPNEVWRMIFGGRYLVLLMGLFSVYTGAIYNECFSRAMSPFPSAWHVSPMFTNGNWSTQTLRGNPFLSLDPCVSGVYQGPYPFGIDPIWSLSNNHLNFLNSYKMKMSVIIGVIHMTFGVCLSVCNYRHFREVSSIVLVFIPEVLFLLCLFGFLVFLIVFKWVSLGSDQSRYAPSILIHFIDMFLFTDNKDNPVLFTGQLIVQKVLVVCALCSVPVLLLGKPLHLWINHWKKTQRRVGDSSQPDRRPLLASEDPSSINTNECDLEHGEAEEEEFHMSEVFMHQAIHTIEYCLGCISNTASYLRLWALSLAHAQLSEVLWSMVMSKGLSWRGALGVGAGVLVPAFAVFGVLTVSILLVMEGLSAFLHALRLHWVEFQNKFYAGGGYKLSPFSFATILNPIVN
ncbi:V-type proton ATPase 116 kDa subunit a 3 isoform X2 [Amia ocellicauda]|uniref:V-type proton ATPase 116 kDa subunit a 3 isoform X2 n=1 Tax=Amia ocellicauda TaxID=2972642 RepID=UPI003464B4BD